MGIPYGAGDVAVAQQPLNRGERGPGFEQAGGEGVTLRPDLPRSGLVQQACEHDTDLLATVPPRGCSPPPSSPFRLSPFGVRPRASLW